MACHVGRLRPDRDKLQANGRATKKKTHTHIYIYIIHWQSSAVLPFTCLFLQGVEDLKTAKTLNNRTCHYYSHMPLSTPQGLTAHPVGCEAFAGASVRIQRARTAVHLPMLRNCGQSQLKAVASVHTCPCEHKVPKAGLATQIALNFEEILVRGAMVVDPEAHIDDVRIQTSSFSGGWTVCLQEA